jgi:hypothetical protein
MIFGNLFGLPSGCQRSAAAAGRAVWTGLPRQSDGRRELHVADCRHTGRQFAPGSHIPSGPPPAEAEIIYRQVLALRPDLAEIRLNCALAQMGQGNMATPNRPYLRKLKMRPPRCRTHAWLRRSPEWPGPCAVQTGRHAGGESAMAEPPALRWVCRSSWLPPIGRFLKQVVSCVGKNHMLAVKTRLTKILPNMGCGEVGENQGGTANGTNDTDNRFLAQLLQSTA